MFTVLHGELLDSQESDEELAAGGREVMWAALAQLPTLGSLQLLADGWYEFPVPFQEEQLLGNVHCRELVLHSSGPWLRISCSGALLLRTVCCSAVHCCQYYSAADNALPWPLFTAKPGVYVLDLGAECSLAVTDCAGSLPGFAQPWALVHWRPHRASISGVPASLFRPGPRGCLVRRNSAATDAYLMAALKQLDRSCWR